jgi:hypothetical protein
MCINQRHTLLPVCIWLHIACYVGVEDNVLGVCVVVFRPNRLRTVVAERLPPRVGVLIMNEADPVAVHEGRQVTVALCLVLEWWGLQCEVSIGFAWYG